MFYFTEDCLIGIEQLDEEHRYLFSLVEKGEALLADENVENRYEKVRELLKKLENYADKHFAHEEAYMEQIRDPELSRQRMQHDVFRNKMSDWLLNQSEDEEEQIQLLEDLLYYLARWLCHHIIGSDIMIGKMPPLDEWMVKENPCEFTDKYLTGITLIDEEHRELFAIVGEAHQLVKSYSVTDNYDEVLNILAKLKGYTEKHFADEEAYMESISYKGLDAQKRAHGAFIEKLGTIDITKVDEEPQKYMESLIEFLLNWLVRHILYVDKLIPCK